MKIKEVVTALERFAPLPLQESYDNAGLQVGLTEKEEVSGVLLCLDVTEAVVDEAVRLGCNLIVAHHPLLFRGLKCIDGRTQVERCVAGAIRHGVAIYAAHTNLDNVRGGVNWRMAEMLGLQDVCFLQEQSGGVGGSGAIGRLPVAEQPLEFLGRVKHVFGVEALLRNEGPQRPVQTVALCGGAGEFLIDEAVAKEADVFLTGEMSYHRFFGREKDLWIGVLGHYQSERHVIGLLRDILSDVFPALPAHITAVITNPIYYMV
ncbi:GTP cyclohydrolase 1 type 2 [Bacteroidaceae bacterium]|uniref:Nif3-like dinuclear metal center hexameric protein n=1 Tax=Prevotella sp. MGM2 TaxID=2033406 RepID=UPI000CEA10BA|nr:Nif3-like dinuclear metal center hexameric protein [Prevotella sp. MGM2]GAY29740.1 Nif3-like dinuclear metal center hexameric protein [Prevotella sp. MGM2]GFI33937.1 GTP cyclohydrolase 1 type 2 [Bacteroidaceae bacterium]